jgi:hypothetical protein
MRKKNIQRNYDDKPYLIRYYILKCKLFQIVLHHILLDDKECLHDHPWNFISIILKGGYMEWHEPQIKPNGDIVVVHGYHAGQILYRKAEWRHRLTLLPNTTCWSLVIMFKRRREWGFWTPKGFKHWEQYESKNNCE